LCLSVERSNISLNKLKDIKMSAKKSNKNKSVVGSTRSKKKKSLLTPRKALFVLVGILCFSVVAGLGYQKWQDNQLAAKALYWTPLTRAITLDGQLNVSGCKTRVSTNYGQAYRVTIYVSNTTGYTRSGYASVVRSGSTIGAIGFTANRHGTTSSSRIYGWVGYPDNISVLYGASGSAAISGLANC